MFAPWLKLATDTTLLAIESHSVIAMRLTQIAVGRGTPAETQLMLTEKMLAFAEATAQIVGGATTQAVVTGYRRKVRANAKRLRR
jgi:hypothetical protein